MNSSPDSAGDSPAKRILIVDSQEMVRSLICRILTSWGLECRPAPDLLTAFRAVLSEGPFDAVVCDYELPDGNAYNLVSLMREQGLKAPTVVPVGALIPMTSPEPGVELLTKPFDPGELKTTLEKMLGVCLPSEVNSWRGKERPMVRA